MHYPIAELLRRADEDGVWAFNYRTLAALCQDASYPYLRILTKRLCENPNRRLLVRAAPGIFVNPTARSLPLDVRSALVPWLRPREVSYVSLQSKLSEVGAISQVSTALTLMTTGDTQTFETPWGNIEFVHTEREISPQTGVLFCEDGLPRATTARAWEDLCNVRRNLDLVDRDLLEEIIREESDEQPRHRP